MLSTFIAPTTGTSGWKNGYESRYSESPRVSYKIFSPSTVSPISSLSLSVNLKFLQDYQLILYYVDQKYQQILLLHPLFQHLQNILQDSQFILHSVFHEWHQLLLLHPLFQPLQKLLLARFMRLKVILFRLPLVLLKDLHLDLQKRLFPLFIYIFT